MDYEKAYKEALEHAKKCLKDGGISQNSIDYIESIFPELKESEDEEIRQAMINFFKSERIKDGIAVLHFGVNIEKIISWLEKQGECETDCPQNHQDSSRPNGCIVCEDFNGGDGFYKLNLDYLNKKQVEEVEEIVRMWNKDSKASNDNIKSCIGMCLTDVNEQRFNDYNTSLNECLNWLEKQGESYTRKDVDDAYLKGISDAKNELEKQGEKLPVGFYYVNSEGKKFHSDTFKYGDVILHVEKQGKPQILGVGVEHASGVLEECIDKIAPMPALESIKEEKVDDANKVEPKFHEGDFIVNGYCMGRIVEITNDAYLLDTGIGIPVSCNGTRLWDITKDAKDGDVLAEDSCIFIMQKLCDNSTAAKTYCALYNDGNFDDGSILYFDIDSTKPATKEQRDTLMKATADAGYTFDFEKKKLKKIEQKSTWSEEDEKHVDSLLKRLEGLCRNEFERTRFAINEDADWLKSLKERIKGE